MKKLLEDCIGKDLGDLWFGSGFLDRRSKHNPRKKKLITVLIKIKHFSATDTVKRMKCPATDRKSL